jgi:adenine-specific DNA-methyltransferase
MAGSDRVLAAPGDPLAYRDTWPGGLDRYLDMLYARLAALRGLLAPTGNLVVHLDWHAVHYAKVLLDELFGAGELPQRDRVAPGQRAQRPGALRGDHRHDAAVRRGARAYWADIHVPHSADYIKSHWRKRDARGPYRLVPLDAPRHGDGGKLVYAWKGKLPAATRTWAVVREAMEALEREGRSRTPRRDAEPQEVPRRVAGAAGAEPVGRHPAGQPDGGERLGYPTQKPVALLERIVAATCPPGGLVLDPFLGSGTTAEAAERLGRRWIGVDSNPEAIRIARARLGRAARDGRARGQAVTADYRSCEACKQVTRRTRTAKGPPLQVRPFTVERLAGVAATIGGERRPWCAW